MAMVGPDPAPSRPESRLSPAEREAVAMLGEGHTAKSIASALGISVHSVNERLREARRKTGLGSSREVARALRTQENRDEKIGVANGSADRTATMAIDGATGAHRIRKGFIAMTIVAVIVGLAALVASPIQQMPKPESPYARLADPGQDTATLFRKVRREPVDQSWAPDAERKLESLYAPTPGVGPVSVLCGTTICEVAGEISPDNAATATEAVQREAFVAAVRAAGFSVPLAFAVGSEAGDEPARFLVYWQRADR